jgi:hypothetical protein
VCEKPIVFFDLPCITENKKRKTTFSSKNSSSFRPFLCKIGQIRPQINSAYFFFGSFGVQRPNNRPVGNIEFILVLLFPFPPTCVGRTYSTAGSCQKMTNDEENFLGINLVPAQLGKVQPGPCSVVVNL